MLSYVKINNFKTYKGEIVVGPLRSLTIVLGRNGSGKSNFTDALGFVMGTGLDVLRASNFVQLIHGGNSGRPISDTASVTAVFILEDGTEKEFTRNIKMQQHSSSAISLYLIDNEEVDEKRYLDELHSSGLCVKFENFFIFQGNVETFVTMKAKNFTSVIEDLSGSGTLRIEYDDLHRKLRKLEDQLNQLALRRKTLMTENRKKKDEMLVYKEYHNLMQELEKTQLDEKLLLLYDNERKVKHCEEECKKFEDSLGMLKRQSARKLEEVKRKNLNNLRLQISKTTSDLHKTETECQKKCQKLKCKERIMENLAHRIKLVADSLEREKELVGKQRLVIEQLEKDLAEVEEMETKYENLIQSQETDEVMEEERVKEYDKLKQETGKQTAALRQQLYVAQKEQKDLQELLDREMCKKLQISHQKQGIGKAIADANTHLQKIDSYVKEKELSLHEKKKLQDKVQAEVSNADKEIEKVKSELENVVKHLDHMNIGSELFLKEKKKQDIVKDLKMTFGDNILGRMSDLCQPVHERYKLAITKVMGKNLHALIVKNKQTALEVINYLKTFQASPEMILPLDSIKCYPIQDKLRNLSTPSGEQVRLLLDVIHCKSRIIEPAVQFAVSNCLVCETTDTARHIAYELDSTVKHNVVSLDGTYYQKGGIVSSGKVSLQEKAKRWMGEEILQAKNRKGELHEKLRELQKQSRMVPDIRNISDEIHTLEIHLKYAKKDKNRVIDKVAELQLQLQEMDTQSADMHSPGADLQQKVLDHCNKIQTIKNEMNLVEDAIFADFCHKIGVTSIREYEGIGLRLYQERAEKRSELATHKQNILTQLDYEQEKLRSRPGILKKKQEFNELKAELERAKLNVQEAEEEKTNHTQKLKDLKLNLQSFKKTLFSAEKDKIKAKDDVKRLAEDIKEGSLQLSNMRLKIENLKHEHRNLLVQCKVQGLNVPMRYGTMADIHESESSLNESLSTSQTEEQDKRRVIVDYSQLSDSLKEARDMEKAVKELSLNIEDTMFKIRTKRPNMKVVEEFDAIQLSLKEVCSETESAVKILRHDGHRFKQIREDRTCRFMECFNSLTTEVDSIYKELYDAQNGEAILTLENPEEPYLAGVRYSVQVPGKKCVAMDCLSGGEAAMASLAFLFALNRYKKAPIIILDEPDASLDHTNVSRFAKFLKKNNNLQIIIITHRCRSAYAVVADDVVGVVKQNENGSAVSKLTILDLKEYQMPEEET